jgi:DNA-binding Lrp family transcriptional regulator
MKKMERNNLQEHLSAEPYDLEPIKAYIFIRSQGGDLIKFLESVKKIQQVKSTSIVAGDYDVVVRVGVQNLEQLMDVTDEIQRMHGIQQTSTHIIEKEVFPPEQTQKTTTPSK